MSLFSRRGAAGRLSDDVARHVPLGRGERVLAHAVDQHTGWTVVLTSWSLAAVDAQHGPVLRRPWREVNAGAWEPTTQTVSVTWIDGSRPAQWALGAGGARVAEVLWERVQASIVVAEEVRLGDRLCGRVAIRKDLATGELTDQVVYARGVRPQDPAVADYVAALRADLRDQAGL